VHGWNQRYENITVVLLLEKPVVLPNICKLKQYIKSCLWQVVGKQVFAGKMKFWLQTYSRLPNVTTKQKEPQACTIG